MRSVTVRLIKVWPSGSRLGTKDPVCANTCPVINSNEVQQINEVAVKNFVIGRIVVDGWLFVD
jgi:hypothetical protein